MRSKAGLRFSNLLTRLLVLAMLFQCAGFDVGSKTLNMVGGGGINSPHPPTSRYHQSSAHGRTGQSGAPPVRHRCANGRLQRLVNSHCPVHTGQSGALSGAPLKFHSGTWRSRVSSWENSSPGPAWPHLAEGAPNSPVHTGQSGAPGPETLLSVICCFSNRFLF
jgi:hypothetical protein